MGVRQGETLSTFLFALYDLEVLLSTNCVKGLTSLSYQLENKCNLYQRLFALLYADYTMILSESHDNLQHHLDVLQRYCKMWQFKVNSDKTKLQSLTQVNQIFSFKYTDIILEIADNLIFWGFAHVFNSLIIYFSWISGNSKIDRWRWAASQWNMWNIKQIILQRWNIRRNDGEV